MAKRRRPAEKEGPKEGTSAEAQAEESAGAPSESEQERAACTPVPVRRDKFNPAAVIHYGLTVDHLYEAMKEFVDFLGFINTQLHPRGLKRLEAMLMPANFTSVVGEFMASAIPKHCLTLAKNQYHNGHPDLLPKGLFPGNALQHGTEGIELKASRYGSGWQGHNPEECWLMVFVFESNRPADAGQGIPPRPFRFKSVYLGQLTKEDWAFSGRSGQSRRTITASVTRSGYEKMRQNWIYHNGSGNPGDDLSEALREMPEEKSE